MALRSHRVRMKGRTQEQAGGPGRGLMSVVSDGTALAHRQRQAGWRRALVALALVVALSFLAWTLWSRSRGSALWRSAQQAARQSDWPRAETALAELAWYRPGDAEAHRLRIQVALKRNDLPTASRLLEQAARG